MRKLSTILLAVAMVFGLAQCKKEQPTPQSEGNVVTITLNVEDGNNNGSRVNVDPTGTNQVTFTDGDQILVASGGKYVGTLTKNDGTFSGTVSADDLVVGQPLYFYFLGNKQGELQTGVTTCTVNISDQTGYPNLPVISMGRSIDPQTGEIVKYESGMTSFSSRLYNKCSLMKFNVTTPSEAAICITGMNNTVTVNFGNPTDEGFEYGMDGDGVIKMKGGSGSPAEKWAIVLPQEAVAAGGDGTAFSVDGAFTGTRGAVPLITENGYLTEGIAVNITNHGYVDLGLPSRLLWATCNVGANTPEEYGDYFAWGETQPNGDTYTYSDNPTILPPENDAATANWGSDWRMPTEAEFYELYTYTTPTLTTQNGVSGCLFTASNGNSLFLPAAGYRDRGSLNEVGNEGDYWSSSLYTPDYAWCFYFDSDIYDMENYSRDYGQSVRAVRSAPQN